MDQGVEVPVPALEVDGDLDHPVLEWAKHSAYDWFGPGDDLARLKENCLPDEFLIHDLIARAVQAADRPANPRLHPDAWRRRSPGANNGGSDGGSDGGSRQASSRPGELLQEAVDGCRVVFRRARRGDAAG